jgi:Effector Associated Constant Component 1
MDSTERKRARLTLSDHSQLRALRDFLSWAAPGARVLQIPLRPVPGERVALDMLTLLATSSGLVAAVKILPEFLRSRDAALAVTITIEDTSVTLTATNVNEILPVLTQLLDA